MAIIDFFDRGWRINPQGDRLHPGRPQLHLQRSGRAVLPHRQRTAGLGLPKETKGAVWAQQRRDGVDLHAGPVARQHVLDSGRCAQSRRREPLRARAFDCEVLFFQKYFAAVIAELQPQPAEDQALDLHRRRDAGCPRFARLTDWIEDQPATRPHVDVDLDDVVILSATGGTTGTPKGVMNTHRSYADLLRALHDRLPLPMPTTDRSTWRRRR